MKLSPILFSAVSASSKVERSASTVCDLTETGIFKLLSNGKYNFVSEYKIKFGARDPGTGNRLSNKGKLAKAKGQFTHRTTGEGFSDGWVACTKNKMSAQYIQCFSDGTFTIDGKSGDDIELPDCTEIGCDSSDLGIFDREYTRQDGCVKGYTDAGLEKDKNQCFRTCGENNSALKNTTKRKVRCMCNYTEKSCEYKIKIPQAGWVDWDGVNENGELHMPLPEDCEDEPKTTESTTPEPTPEPTEPTGPQWGEWGEWKPCSIKCSVGGEKGVQRRFRSCESDTETCTGDDNESQECEPEDGDCGLVCPFPIGHFQQSYDDRCDATFVQANGGLHMQQNGKCKFINCDSENTRMMDFDQWVCNCNSKGVCRWKINGSIQSLDFLDPVTQCAGLQGGRGGHDKSWAWVDGRRSLSTLASEVTDWDLQDICYDPTVSSGVYSQAQTWSLDEIAGARTYGRVVELDDGLLACQFSKGSQVIENRTIYVQLATKPGAMTWASSERFYMYRISQQYSSKPDRKHKGEYWGSEMVFPGNNGPQNMCQNNCGMDPQGILLSMRQNWKWFWPHEHNTRAGHPYSGKLPAHPALCRVQKDGQWYNGAVSYATEFEKESISPYTYSSYSIARDIFCTAYDNDGNAITGKNHNRHFRPESGDDEIKSEYFVIGSDDGSKWGDWSEWSSCGATCGPNARRIKTRQCLDSSGAEIDWKTGYNCLPDWESDETTQDDSDWVEISTTRWMLCDFEEYSNKDECPGWGSWSGWSDCSQSCGLGGRSTRTRGCLCKFQTFNGEDVWDSVGCDDLPDDNPWKTENMCGDPSESIVTQACHEDRVCAKSDGVGPGCFSDTYSFNTNQMRCYKTNCLNLGWCQHVGPSVYHNEHGLVPHLYTCYADTWNVNFAHTCSSGLGFDRQVLTKDKTSTCECHQGKCEWGMFETPTVKRQDCTVNYEWLKLPIQTDHPFYNQVVDFTNPSKTGSDVSRAIAARHIYDNGVGSCMVGGITIGRRLPDWEPVTPDESGTLTRTASGEEDMSFVLTAQCKEGGSIKWKEGPYTCTGSNCLREYIQIDRSNHLRDWTLCGLNRRGFKTSGWMNSGIELDRLGLCRMGSDEEGWNIGTIIRYRRDDDDGTRPVKCCLHSDDWSGETVNDRIPGCLMNDGMDYSNLPYQMLWAGDCQ